MGTKTDNTTTATSSNNKKSLAASFIPVERATDAKQFQILIQKEPKRPVIYQLKARERFRAHSKWNSSFFAKRSGTVHIHTSKHSSEFFNITQDSIWQLANVFVKTPMAWPEFMDQITRQKQHMIVSGTDTHMLMEDGTVVEPWKDCLEDVRPGLDDFVPGTTHSDTMDRIGIWVSGPNISSQTHWDINGDSNLNFQIRGSKRFLLWEPMDGQEHLYPLPFRFWNISRIPDPYHVDLKQYPLYRHAKPFFVEMNEGDVLYIPPRWWHHVTHCGNFNVNVTAWYQSQYHKRRPHPIKSFCVPRAVQGLIFLVKIVCVVIVTLFLMIWRKLGGIVNF